MRFHIELILLYKKLCQKPLTSEKPCINKEFHASLKHRYLTFHMQDENACENDFNLWNTAYGWKISR